MAASSVDLLAMGGDTKPKAEMFNFASRSWREITRFPFGGAVETLAPLIFTDEFYYTFGGYRGEDYNYMPTDSSIIARLSIDGSTWEKKSESLSVQDTAMEQFGMAVTSLLLVAKVLGIYEAEK